MPIFEQLKRAGFEGIEFPIESCEVNGSIRDHIHVYPHAAGGQPEKMGRNLYLIKMTSNFHATFKAYPNLWPLGLSKLRKLFESQTTGALVIPTIGTIQAYCRNWSQVLGNKLSSGEKVTFEFVEDSDTANLVEALIAVRTADLSVRVEAFNAAAAASEITKDPKVGDLFDAIGATANSVLAVADQFELQGNILKAKVDYLDNLLNQADRLKPMGDPSNLPLIEAMHALWDSVVSVRLNAKKSALDPQVYVTPTTMAMSAVSQTLYGNNEHTVELMQLNGVPDAFAVRAGTRLTWIPVTA